MSARLADLLIRNASQAEFAELIGVSEAKVSQMLSEGVLTPGNSARQWLLTYLHRLREEAAGRSGDGQLAANRAAESLRRTRLLDIQIAQKMRQIGPVSTLSEVLAHVGRQARDRLERIPMQMRMQCPHLTADDIRFIGAELAQAANLLVDATLESLQDPEDGEAVQEPEGVDDLEDADADRARAPADVADESDPPHPS